MKLNWNLTLISIALIVLSSFAFQTEENTKIEENAVRLDSLELVRLDQLHWKFYGAAQEDSLAWVGKQMYDISNRILKVRDDSIFNYYRLNGLGLYGQGLAYQGYFEEGLAKLEQALHEGLAYFGPIIRLTQGFVGLSVGYAKFGDYERSIAAQFQSLKILQEIVDEESPYYAFYASIYHNLMLKYIDLQEFDRAVYYGEKARVIYDRVDPVLYLVSNLALTSAYLGKNEPEKALALNESLLALANKELPANSFIYAYLYASMAKIMIATGNLKAAESLLYKGLEAAQNGKLTEQYNHREWQELEIQKLLVALYEKSGNYEQAIEHYKKIEEVWYSYQGQANLLQSTHSVGYAAALSHLKRYDESLAIIQKAIHWRYPEVQADNWTENPSLDKLRINPATIELMEAKTMLLMDLSDIPTYEVDEKLIWETFDLTEKLLEAFLKLYQEGAKSTFIQKHNELLERTIQFALQRYRTTEDEIYLQRVFQGMERSKATRLKSKLNARTAQHSIKLPTALKAKENRLVKELGIYRNLVYQTEHSAAPDSALLTYYQDKLFQLNLDQQELEKEIIKRFPAYHRLKYDYSLPELSELKHKLSLGECVLIYFWGKKAVYSMSISASAYQVATIPMDQELEQSLITYQQWLSTPTDNVRQSEMETLGTELYQKLLATHVETHKPSSLVIIPDGPLNLIPFQVLVPVQGGEKRSVGQADNYLVGAIVSRLAYSVGTWLHPIERKGTSSRYLGFAPAYTGEDQMTRRGIDTLEVLSRYRQDQLNTTFGALQFNRSEIKESASSIGVEAKVFLEGQALESQFKQEIPNGSILHLAMHSFTNVKDPMYSYLVFSQEPDTTEDGLLHAYEIYNMELDADLAVLSACNTGVGQLAAGEGTMSLAQAFKYAGCSTVLMSLWPADDATTKEVVVSFFRYLDAGWGKDKALQQAQLDFLGNPKNVEYQHPYYWAGFVLIGDALPLSQFQHHSSFWRWGILVPLLILLFLVLRMRFR